jgi:hypothetical protein
MFAVNVGDARCADEWTPGLGPNQRGGTQIMRASVLVNRFDIGGIGRIDRRDGVGRRDGRSVPTLTAAPRAAPGIN